MRIVSPQEAVAGIRSRDQIYLQCAAATPEVLLEALVARAPELEAVSIVHLHTEGPGPHLAPEMAPHFRHRALFIGPNARQAVNEGRADFVPVFLSDVPDLFLSGALPLDAVFVNATPPDAHGFCSLGVSVEAMHAAISAARTVIVQFNAAMPRTLGESFIHVSQIDLAVEVDAPIYEAPRPGHRGHRAAHRVVHRRPGPGRRDPPAGDRRHPGRHRGVPRRQEGPGHPHRDVHRRRGGPRRGGGGHRRRQGAQHGQARRGVHDGDEAAVRLRGRQPDGRDARGRLHQRHPRHPLVPPHDRDQLGDRGGPRRARWWPIRSATGCTRASAGRWTSCAGPRWPATAGRSSPCPPPPAPDNEISRITPALKEGAGIVTTRAHVRTVVTEFGVAELWGKSLRERAQGADRDRAPGPPRPAHVRGAAAPRAVASGPRGGARSGRGATQPAHRGPPAPPSGASVASRPSPRDVSLAWRSIRRTVRSLGRGATGRRTGQGRARARIRGPALTRAGNQEPSPRRGLQGFGWVPGVPSGTHLTRIVGSAPNSR